MSLGIVCPVQHSAEEAVQLCKQRLHVVEAVVGTYSTRCPSASKFGEERTYHAEAGCKITNDPENEVQHLMLTTEGGAPTKPSVITVFTRRQKIETEPTTFELRASTLNANQEVCATVKLLEEVRITDGPGEYRLQSAI
jgi:hypothetical protein